MKFYVYTLAYPDGGVFYVGKGSRNRIDEHEYEARSGKNITNPYKVAVIRKIWAGGGEVVKAKIYETADEHAAFEVERETIGFYGRSNLTNLTDGGEGMSEDDAAKHSLRMREQNHNAKVWVGFIDPFGVEHRNIHNLYRFCEEYDLGYYSMTEVDKGARDNYRGWRRIGRMPWVATEFVAGDRFDAYSEFRENPTIFDLERYEFRTFIKEVS